MSDPRQRDPHYDPDTWRQDETRSRRLAELGGSNAMWGWIAGAVIVALVVIFVFIADNGTDTASNTAPPPAATTGSAPNAPAAGRTTQAPKPAPSTTGQGTGQGGSR